MILDNFLSGCIAGSIGAFCVLPIDITKTRIQSFEINSNPIKIISTIYQTNGIRGFYKGGITQILFVSPEKAIKFTVNDFINKHMDNKIIAGMCAGFSQVIVTNPMEILKIQMQTNLIKKKYSLIDAIKQIGGITKLYKGASICAMRDIPFSGIYFPLYSKLSTNTNINTYQASLFSGMIAAFLCTPMDVIKTKIQYELNSTPIVIFNSIINCNGYKGLFKGGSWRALKSGPQFMITQIVYNHLTN